MKNKQDSDSDKSLAYICPAYLISIEFKEQNKQKPDSDKSLAEKCPAYLISIEFKEIIPPPLKP